MFLSMKIVPYGVPRHSTSPRQRATSSVQSGRFCNPHLGIKQRSRAFFANSTYPSSSSRRDANASVHVPGAPWALVASSIGYHVCADDSSDDELEAPLHANVIGSRVQSDDLFGNQGTFDGNNYEAPDWDEVSSLISFDAEEHKYVTRYMPKERQRVEDMMGSFDGDDFEAVMRAAKGGEASADEAAIAAVILANGSSTSSSDGSGLDDLYVSVSRRRATAMAAEQQKRKNPQPRRRKAPLGSQPAEAWMFEVPVLVQGQPQLTAEQYAAAQRAMLPPLHLTNGSSAPVEAAAPPTVQQHDLSRDVLVVLLGRPGGNGAAAAPAPHAVQQQGVQHPATTHPPVTKPGFSSCSSQRATLSAAAEGLDTSLGSSINRNGSSRIAVLPTAVAPESLLNGSSAAAVYKTTSSTHQQGKHIVAWALSATPAPLLPLTVASAALSITAADAPQQPHANGNNLHTALQLSALPSSCEDEVSQDSGQSSVGPAAAGITSQGSVAPEGCIQHVTGTIVAMCGRGAAERQHLSRSALRRALPILKKTKKYSGCMPLEVPL